MRELLSGPLPWYVAGPVIGLMGHGTRYWAGGILFGVGWAPTGACPGPLVALIGSGATSISSRPQAPWRARGRPDGRGRTRRIED